MKVLTSGTNMVTDYDGRGCGCYIRPHGRPPLGLSVDAAMDFFKTLSRLRRRVHRRAEQLVALVLAPAFFAGDPPRGRRGHQNRSKCKKAVASLPSVPSSSIKSHFWKYSQPRSYQISSGIIQFERSMLVITGIDFRANRSCWAPWLFLELWLTRRS